MSQMSSKQKVVARSSTEVEYRALALTSTKIIWIKFVLLELYIILFHVPMLNCDNMCAKMLVANSIMHVYTKHVEIDQHFVHDRVVQGFLDLKHIAYADQLVDTLTNHLSEPTFHSLEKKLTMLPPP